MSSDWEQGDDGWGDDGWSDDDWGDEDDAPSITVPCPACAAEVYEDAEQCPHCGEYIIGSASVWDGKPTWWIIIGGLGVIATLIALTAL